MTRDVDYRPHTAQYVSSYYYLILLNSCPHTTICRHTAIGVSSYLSAEGVASRNVDNTKLLHNEFALRALSRRRCACGLVSGWCVRVCVCVECWVYAKKKRQEVCKEHCGGSLHPYASLITDDACVKVLLHIQKC